MLLFDNRIALKMIHYLVPFLQLRKTVAQEKLRINQLSNLQIMENMSINRDSKETVQIQTKCF